MPIRWLKHGWNCFTRYSLWRKARALDRASVVLWKSGDSDLYDALQKLSRPLWEEIHGRDNLPPALLILLCFALSGFANPLHAAPADTISVPRAELERIHADFQTARAQLAQADTRAAAAESSLATAANTTIPTLQKQVQAEVNARADAEAKNLALEKQVTSKNRVIFWLTLPLAVLCAAAVLWGCLKLDLPNLAPPYGVAILALRAMPRVRGSHAHFAVRLIL